MEFRFRVFGIVTVSETGAAAAGLIVRGFDKDLIFDDSLGEAKTDAEGRFEIVYTDEAFRSAVDQWPDIYLQVWDASGTRQLYSTDGAIRWNAGTDEQFLISISEATLSKATLSKATPSKATPSKATRSDSGA